MLSPANPEESGGGRFLGGGRDGETLVVPNVVSPKRAEGPLPLVVLRTVLTSSSFLLASRGRRRAEIDKFSGTSWFSGGTNDWSRMSARPGSGLADSVCVTTTVEDCKSGSANGWGGGGDLIGI